MPDGPAKHTVRTFLPKQILQRSQKVYYGWWMAIAGMVIGTFGALNNYGFSIFFLPVTTELGLSRAQTSLVFSAARLEGGIEAPIAGWLTDRLGPRTMLLIGNTMTGVGFILLGTVAHSFWALFVIWVFIISVGFQTGFFTAMVATMNMWFVRRRATAISLLSSSNRLGGVIWAPVLGYLVVAHGWRTTSVIAGILILLVTIPMSLLFRTSPESMGLQPDGDTDATQATSEGTNQKARHMTVGADHTVKQAVRTRAYWQFTLATAFQMASMGAISVHLIPILVWKGQSQQTAAYMLGLVGFIGTGMTLVWGQLSDRFGPVRMQALAGVLGALGLVTLALGDGPLVYVFLVLHAVAESASALTIATTGLYFGRKHFATVRGVLTFTNAPVGFAMPIFAGWVYDQTQSYWWVIVPLVAFRAMAIPLYLLMPKPSAPGGSAAKVS